MTKEQLIDIEKLYREMLPLPNPDAHEVIGEKIDLAPSKAFFGINLIREKMRLPKLEYPKRKLAVTPEQLMAIETLYEPYLPVPPLGIHKIIAKQLKMDEWRVHVAIGLIRKNRNLNRWNEDREDLPAEMKKQIGELNAAKAAEAEAKKAQKEKEQQEKAEQAKAEKAAKADDADDVAEEPVVAAKPAKKTAKTKAAAAAGEAEEEPEAEPAES